MLNISFVSMTKHIELNVLIINSFLQVKPNRLLFGLILVNTGCRHVY